MKNYAAGVMLLHAGVQFLLIMGSSRLCDFPRDGWRFALGAVVAGLYAGTCLLPGCLFLGATPCRFALLTLVVILAYGIHIKALQCGVVLVLLNIVLEGITVGMEMEKFSVMTVGGLVILRLLQRIQTNQLIPLQLCFQGKEMDLLALRDTGNTLRDPLTGRSVLVVSSNVAEKMTGLSCQELQSPVDAMMMQKVPGLQLVPYSSIGKHKDFLLAVRMKVKVGRRKWEQLVAFAPNGFCEEDAYQALTGGNVR